MEYNQCYSVLGSIFSENNLPVFRNLEKTLTPAQQVVFANRMVKQVATLLDRSLAANEANKSKPDSYKVYFPLNPEKVELVFDIFESKEELVGKQRVKPFESIVTVVCDGVEVVTINYSPIANPLKSLIKIKTDDGDVQVEGSWSKEIKPFFGPTPTKIYRAGHKVKPAAQASKPDAAPASIVPAPKAKTEAATIDDSSVDDIVADIDETFADETAVAK